MKADPRFTNKPVQFWAYVRSVSEALGYSIRERKSKGVVTVPASVRNPLIEDLFFALSKMDQPTDALGSLENPSHLAIELSSYLSLRAELINEHIRRDLMTAEEARTTFLEVQRELNAVPTGIPVLNSKREECAVDYKVAGQTVRVPMNKQKGVKRFESYLTGIINLVVADALQGLPCDYDPRSITRFDHEDTLYQTFSRRQDGAFPSTRNPISIWEIKEYYYTTTFGSKISDAVYITSLDGYEREELERVTKIKINHLVMVDSYETWWGKGRSYLCRMIDILHMGHVDEILFGREVVTALPEIAREWAAEFEARKMWSTD
ncbi:DUF7687 domain-containing protein [Gordonia sp. DT219]|uniref:DUF7687 domain-containing protein n=1 Tax=Gordonia sp. DT219 TaxID=3416658 RepID=UPI003CF16CF8